MRLFGSVMNKLRPPLTTEQCRLGRPGSDKREKTHNYQVGFWKNEEKEMAVKYGQSLAGIEAECEANKRGQGKTKREESRFAARFGIHLISADDLDWVGCGVLDILGKLFRDVGKDVVDVLARFG